MEDYFRRGHFFQKRLGIQPMPRREARYLLFRISCNLMQGKLAKLIDLTKVPVTFLHGNPHLDNYVRTNQGSAMVDFDRSRMGPYCWDIIRFLSSLSLRREENDGFLDRRVIELFIDSYMTHFLHPDIPAKQVKMLKHVQPEKWQLTTKAYLQANKKWAKKMRENAINPRSEQVRNLLLHFLESRHELGILDDYMLSEAGLTPGSLGKKHFIMSLVPKNSDSRQDSILLDIKEVYEEKNNKFFHTPHPHHGERMILASKLFADGIEERLGACTYQGKQYWGRQIPSFAIKVKKNLNKEEQLDFAYSVASELGKGHRKGLVDSAHAELIENDFNQNFDRYVKVSKLLTYEIRLAFVSMMKLNRLYQDYRNW